MKRGFHSDLITVLSLFFLSWLVNESCKSEFIDLRKWLKERNFEDRNLAPAHFPGKIWCSALRPSCKGCGKSRGGAVGWLCFPGGYFGNCVLGFLPCSYTVFIFTILYLTLKKITENGLQKEVIN